MVVVVLFVWRWACSGWLPAHLLHRMLVWPAQLRHAAAGSCSGAPPPLLPAHASRPCPRCPRVYALKPPAAGRKGGAAKQQALLRPAAETARDFYVAATLAKRPFPLSAPGAKPERAPLFQVRRRPAA